MTATTTEHGQLPFQRRDEFDQELYLRPLSTNARRFLQIMFQAANGTPDDDVQGDFHKERSQYVMSADQLVLANLIGVSRSIKDDSRTKAVRRVVEELEQLKVMKRYRPTIEVDGKPVRSLAYVLSLSRLIDLPCVDINTPVGRTMVDLIDFDPFDEFDTETPSSGKDVRADLGTNSCASSELSTQNQRPSGPVSGGLSGGLSGPSKNPVMSCPVPAKTKSHSIPHDHEQDLHEGLSFDFDIQEGPTRRFDQIPDDHIRAIAGFSPGGRAQSDLARKCVFLEYFRDACQMGFAEPSDAVLMLALFRCCGQRMSDDCPDKTRVRDPQMWIRTYWTNRHQRPLLKIAQVGKSVQWAKDILRLKNPAEQPA
ncbi:MAG: hypothetical protein ABJZ55_01940 [Fuerstiella sp.]